MRFSQRIGKKPVKTQIQFESMDQDLRVGLWNLFKLFFIDAMDCEAQYQSNRVVESSFHVFFQSLWHNHFRWPIHLIPSFLDSACNQILDWFRKAEWYEVYDFIEFVSQTRTPVNTQDFQQSCNNLLEREVSAYRFVGNELAPITNASELAEIESALANTQVPRMAGANDHLASALAKLSDRQSPDYRNSIKESISAVESLCRLMAKKRPWAKPSSQ
jgi:hypothetical protein